MITELMLLFVAGIIGGSINSMAGGGSFVTFPALIFAGLPPVMANATNTFSSSLGYFSGAYALRGQLYVIKERLFYYTLVSLVGGFSGAWLLLQLPDITFKGTIPWLLLCTTLLLIFGGKVSKRIRNIKTNNTTLAYLGRNFVVILLLAICFYGGYFNAGFGFVILSYLTLAGQDNIHIMNAVKLLISAIVSVAAIFLFIYQDQIAWHQGTAVMAGTLIGGYVSASYSKRIPENYTRGAINILSVMVTVFFFYIEYFDY